MGVTVIVALSAERGAGKTTLAAAIAADLSAVHARVSGWLASRIEEQGRVPTADALREAGEHAAANPASLVEEVLAFYRWQPGRGLIFDAVRHSGVLDALRKYVAPQPVLHVALTLDREAIEGRLARRGDTAQVEAGRSHSTEAQVPSLIAAGDVVLDAASKVDVLVDRVRRSCQALR